MKPHALIALSLLVAACEESSSYAQATCVLIDTSGTYADQKTQVTDIVKKALVARMLPGDSLITIAIDDNSYEKKNVKGVVTLDNRPSRANTQKLAFSRQLARFAKQKARARYTDIRGGMMLCGEYLNETKAGNRVIVVFSDMKEELPPGTRRQFGPKEFDNTHVVAMNVKRLKADNIDPTAYRKRLVGWGKAVKDHGALDWNVVLEPDKLVEYLDEIR